MMEIGLTRRDVDPRAGQHVIEFDRAHRIEDIAGGWDAVPAGKQRSEGPEWDHFEGVTCLQALGSHILGRAWINRDA